MDYKALIAGLLFTGGVPAIIGAVEWVKRFFESAPPKWVLAVTPLLFGLAINVGGAAALGYFKEFGVIAIAGSIIAGFVAGYGAMGIYDIKSRL